MKINLVLSFIFVFVIFSSNLSYSKTKINICPKNAQECLKYESRHFQISYILSYKYIDNSDFRRCVKLWKDELNSVDCRKFEREIFQIAESVGLTELRKITDSKFTDIIEAYIVATKKYWGSDIEITEKTDSNHIIESIARSIKKYRKGIEDDDR